MDLVFEFIKADFNFDIKKLNKAIRDGKYLSEIKGKEWTVYAEKELLDIDTSDYDVNTKCTRPRHKDRLVNLGCLFYYKYYLDYESSNIVLTINDTPINFSINRNKRYKKIVLFNSVILDYKILDDKFTIPPPTAQNLPNSGDHATEL